MDKRMEPISQIYSSSAFRTVGKCPKCGESVWGLCISGESQNECPKCGQKLLWRDV